MKDIYYLTLLVITALGSSVMTSYAPAMLARIKRLFTRKKRFTNTKPCSLIQIEVDELQKKVKELEEQMDNVAQNSYRREQNRKNNIRREVRDYLEELKNG